LSRFNACSNQIAHCCNDTPTWASEKAEEYDFQRGRTLGDNQSFAAVVAGEQDTSPEIEWLDLRAGFAKHWKK
jgi:hypothetical protein